MVNLTQRIESTKGEVKGDERSLGNLTQRIESFKPSADATLEILESHTEN